MPRTLRAPLVLSAFSAFVTVSLAVACGGAPRPQPASGNAGDPTVASGGEDERATGVTAPQPLATASASPSAKPPSARSIEASHAQFMGECAKTPDLKGYCECAWGVSKKTLSPEELANDRTDREHMAALQGQVMRECSAQLPESAVRSGYLDGCERGEPAMKAYCECLWPELRQKLSVTELASPDQVRTPKFAGAVKAGANKCGAKLPEETVRKSFFTGCTGGRSESEAFCTCAWKELRSKMSLPDIQSAGVGDSSQLEQMKASIDKACSKLKPAAH